MSQKFQIPLSCLCTKREIIESDLHHHSITQESPTAECLENREDNPWINSLLALNYSYLRRNSIQNNLVSNSVELVHLLAVCSKSTSISAIIFERLNFIFERDLESTRSVKNCSIKIH